MTFAARTASNPLPGFRFAVAFAESEQPAGALAQGGVDKLVAGFSEVSGLDASIEIHEYKEGGRNDFVHKFATRATFGNLSFKRGVAVTQELWSWYDRVRRGSYGLRRSILIAHLDYAGEVALVWYAARALPTKYTGPSWNAGQSSVAIESIDVVHEGLEQLPASAFGLSTPAPASP